MAEFEAASRAQLGAMGPKELCMTLGGLAALGQQGDLHPAPGRRQAGGERARRAQPGGQRGGDGTAQGRRHPARARPIRIFCTSEVPS